MQENPNEKILKLLQEKVLLKQEVFEKTKNVFDELKKKISRLAGDLRPSIKNLSKEIPVEYKDTGDYEVEFTLADETLVYVMHSNIFTFDSSHKIWKDKYVQQDPNRAFCGKIFVYNFLSDSFRFNRTNDVGYLIARIFINREGHYFVEGKRQFGYLYSDFTSSILDSDNLDKIIESSILYSLDFDPFTPPFDLISEVSVREILETNLQSRIATGKRLGFQFGGEEGQTIG
jgi:hypothetical protein